MVGSAQSTYSFQLGKLLTSFASLCANCRRHATAACLRTKCGDRSDLQSIGGAAAVAAMSSCESGGEKRCSCWRQATDSA